ncbi:hypothetical protein CWI38_1276p0020 [Hamiltosporidium tvaerminnensis]|uniref:Integrase catalytic domain-containing protein n=1 Tax=Hamiltosporidium tvaerminnensis TaxID=1176355 RepID=A0A4V2JXD1_9MICR|nr:hypothetical protein CWI38_1276p0020 [Hamiltosporidium tvaerminnensis]
MPKIVSCKNTKEKEILTAYLKTVNIMMALIAQKYYGIPKEYIKEYVKDCEACGDCNIKTIQPIYINHITKKYDLFMMDCVDLRRYSDQNDTYSWILYVIDTYTKHLWSFWMIEKNSKLVRDSLKFLFNNFGVSVAIQSDNSREFKNALLEAFLTDVNIKIIHKRPRNSKAKGQVERVNQTIKRWLAKKLHETGGRRWIEHLNKLFVHIIEHYIIQQTNLHLCFSSDNQHNNENEASMIVPAIDIDPDIVLVEENATDTQWILEIASDVHEEFTETVITIIADDLGSERKIRSDVAKDFKKYRERIIESNNSNKPKRDLSIGDQVLIKKRLRYKY